MKPKKELNMKRLFRRNQVIITTLAVMIAAAGYLNYAGKQELEAGSQVFEAGMLEISDEDILAENQASPYYGETLAEIGSLDQDILDDTVEDAVMEGEAAGEETLAAGAAGQTPGGENLAAGAAGQTPGSENLAAGAEVQAAEGETLASGMEGQAAGADGLEENPAEGGAAVTGLENPGEAVLTSGMSVTDYIANVQLSREQVRARNKEALMNLINSTGIEEAAKQQAVQDMIALTETAEKENAAETLLMAKGFADPVVSVSSGQVDVVIHASSITDQQRAQIEDIVKRKTEMAADQIVISLLNLEE
ncbi:MAG: SpoIIIAH-like family protein [Lachnospiraceae bacterium]|nr:SpoIIIAH-like family protein [Lachnospiraceae bacterium]